MNYENAFNCKDCPESNGKKGCPAWLDIIEENDKGEIRATKTCLLTYMPQFIKMLTRSDNRVTENVSKINNNVSKVNNTIANGFVALSHTMKQGMMLDAPKN